MNDSSAAAVLLQLSDDVCVFIMFIDTLFCVIATTYFLSFSIVWWRCYATVVVSVTVVALATCVGWLLHTAHCWAWFLSSACTLLVRTCTVCCLCNTLAILSECRTSHAQRRASSSASTG